MMKAVVWHGPGDIRVENVAEPEIVQSTDAIVRMTASAICGTDLHIARGSLAGMRPGTILGHEGVGVVQEVGRDVRNLQRGDRVVIPSTIGCGCCNYCRAGYYAQCNVANPKGPSAGTAFFGGPESTGPFDGLLAEFARVPFANAGLVRLPDEISDDEALILSDIFPTGYFGAHLAEVTPGDTVAVFGCGPVGQFAIVSALMMGAGRVFAVDSVPERLQMAREQGAEVINFNEDHPVTTLRRLTGGSGPDRVIDAVGIDAEPATGGPAVQASIGEQADFERELLRVAPRPREPGSPWAAGEGPSQALIWEVDAVAKAGTLAIVGVYLALTRDFPMGRAMSKNLTIHSGNCNHRRYIPQLIAMIRTGRVKPLSIIHTPEHFHDPIEAYEAFDRRPAGWIKITLAAREAMRATG